MRIYAENQKIQFSSTASDDIRKAVIENNLLFSLFADKCVPDWVDICNFDQVLNNAINS